MTNEDKLYICKYNVGPEPVSIDLVFQEVKCNGKGSLMWGCQRQRVFV